MKNLISKCIVYGLNGHNFSLESVSMPGGRIVNTAENGEIMFVPMMYFTDNLGSIRSVVEATSGTELKHYDYYPYGLEWGYDHKDNSSEYRYKFNGKEDQGMFGVDYLDYGARLYDPYIASWISPDPLSRKYPNISPYVFCNSNPVNFVDPDGKRIESSRRQNINYLISDLKNIFRDKKFDAFRKLFSVSRDDNKTYYMNQISQEALKNALQGVQLTQDEKALLEIVVNTINSNSNHVVEYLKSDGYASKVFTDRYLDEMATENDRRAMQSVVDFNGGFLPAFVVINAGGGGATLAMKNGSVSEIFIDFQHPNGRAVTMGHELFGHGRPISLGRVSDGKSIEHVDAIQVENLILRVMGIDYINNGINHGTHTIIENPSDLPSFR